MPRNDNTVSPVPSGPIGGDFNAIAPIGTTGQVITHNGTSWVAGTAGSGDVVGPASSVLNQLALFADTTGKLLKASTHVLDGSGNELLKFASVASAVNEITITNAATLGPPIIEATGGDTNIGLWFKSKGTGIFYFGDGTAGTDYELQFVGEDSTGIFRWMEDEDYFAFIDSVLLNGTRRLYINDSTSYLYGTSAGNITLSGATTTNVGTVSGTTTVGVLGDIGLGTAGQASVKKIYPKTSLMIDRGDSTHLFGDDYLGGKIKYYNAIATVSGGVPSELATVDLATQAAAISTTTVYTPAATGLFRISVYLQITRAATTSSILGGTTGVLITYTDGDGSVAQSVNVPLFKQDSTLLVTATGNTTNTTATNSQGSLVIYAKTAVAIQYAVGYTSVGATTMQFAAHLKVEAL